MPFQIFFPSQNWSDSVLLGWILKFGRKVLGSQETEHGMENMDEKQEEGLPPCLLLLGHKATEQGSAVCRLHMAGHAATASEVMHQKLEAGSKTVVNLS